MMTLPPSKTKKPQVVFGRDQAHVGGIATVKKGDLRFGATIVALLSPAIVQVRLDTPVFIEDGLYDHVPNPHGTKTVFKRDHAGTWREALMSEKSWHYVIIPNGLTLSVGTRRTVLAADLGHTCHV